MGMEYVATIEPSVFVAQARENALSVVIPDLWHVAKRLGFDTREGKAVLETWYIANALRNLLAEAQGKLGK